MKNNFSKLCCVALCATFALPLAACGNKSDQVTLLVDLHGWMPSTSTITSAGSTPYTATRLLAEEFMRIEPNIKIEWATTKPVGDDSDSIATWFTTKINTDSCPAIAFSWGTSYQDRDWYVSLDEYLETPNEYEEGNTKWKNMFEDYLWQMSDISNARGDVVALPLVLYAGTATGYYYNKDIVTDAIEGNKTLNGLLTEAQGDLNKVLSSYTNFNKVLEAVEDEYGSAITKLAPSADVGGIQFGSWVMQYCLGPAYAGKLMDRIDYDHDGYLSSNERVRATLEGYFDPTKYEGARELLAYVYEYYNETLENGWQSQDYDTIWKMGNVAFKESGIWSYNIEASTVHGSSGNTYEWGVMPSPVLSSDSNSQFVNKMEYTEKGFYHPSADLQVNIMKPAVQGKDDVLQAAVKFLKFLTTVENNEYMVGAKDSGLPAVIGAEYPATIRESGYAEQSFPKSTNAQWPSSAFTTDQTFILNTAFREWIGNKNVDPRDYSAAANTSFYNTVSQTQRAGALALVNSLKLDTTGWNI